MLGCRGRVWGECATGAGLSALMDMLWDRGSTNGEAEKGLMKNVPETKENIWEALNFPQAVDLGSGHTRLS